MSDKRQPRSGEDQRALEVAIREMADGCRDRARELQEHGSLPIEVVISRVGSAAAYLDCAAKLSAILDGNEVNQTTIAARIARRQRFKNWWLPALLVDPLRRCPHLRQRGIYGDEIIMAGYKRARCLDCGRLLPDLPQRLVPVESSKELS